MDEKKLKALEEELKIKNAINREKVNSVLGTAAENVKDISEKIKDGTNVGKKKTINVLDATKEMIEENIPKLGNKIPNKKPISSISKNLDKLDSKGMTASQAKSFSTGKKALGVAAVFIATTTLLDKALDIDEKMEVKKMVREQNKNIKKREEQEREKRDRYRDGKGFTHVDTSSIVMDLFEERLGHHKMGNSRF